MNHTNIKSNEGEIDLRELFNTFPQYKWSILLITVATLILGSFSLYFKTDTYSSTGIIEVKSSKQHTTMNDDIIGNTFSSFGDEKVDKEIEILKTFHITNHALKKVNFQSKFFIDEGLKKVEIDDNIPIKVKNVTIFNQLIVGRLVKLIPNEDGFHLQVENSFKNIILHSLFDKEIIEIDDKKKYPYDRTIKTDDFELTIEKKDTKIDIPIYFILQDSNMEIYRNILNNLEIYQINSSAPLIEITYKDTTPNRANAYVNSLMESFIFQSVADKSKQNDRIIDFINNQLDDMKTKLDSAEEKLEKYRIKHQAIDPQSQAQNYINELSNIEIELSKNKLKEKLIQTILPFVKKGKNIDAIAPSLMELNDQPTLGLISRLQEAQIKEEGLQGEYSAKHPGLIAVRKQISHIKKKIILSIENLKSSMLHRNENLKKLKKSFETNLKSLPTQERTLINLKRDYEVSSQTYNYLLKKKSENEMIKVAILSDYRIIEPASSMYIDPKYLLNIILALILGFILGTIQAFIRNAFDDKIKTREDIEKLTTLPIYGILPALKQKTLKLEVFKNPKSPFSESYRSFRTNLQFARKANQANVILVTSTIAGEGKSTTVANLGSIFQMANYKCIVINLDLRKPTLHQYFEVKNKAGLSTYLSGKNRIGDIIQSTAYKNLDIISAGPIPPNPSELILSDKLDELFDTLKEVYDYIFIDSSPLGLVTDTMHLMQYADISLIVFRENYAHKSFVTDLNNLVKSHDLKDIGIVLNSVDTPTSSYGYGYGYG